MALPYPPNVAHFDANQVPTVMGVIGTLGTADVGGTALSLPVGVNPATGAMFVQDLSGAGGTTNIQGSVIVTSGTILNTGTNVNVVTGTINSLPQISVGTIPQVSVGTMPQVSVGTLPTLNLTTGTVNLVSNLTNGSVNILTGTTTLVSTVTTLSNLTNGSVNILTGTLQNSGSTTGVGVVSNLTNGSVNILTGTTTLVSTVTTLSNLTNGSVNLLTGTLTRASNIGTIESGTMQLNPVPVPSMLTFGTLGTAGGSFMGTLSAASGAGTKHYISGASIVMNTGTADVRILAGSSIQGTGVLVAGQYPVGGGIVREFNPVFATGTNSELIYHFVGAGTAFITVQYWKGV